MRKCGNKIGCANETGAPLMLSSRNYIGDAAMYQYLMHVCIYAV